MRKDKHLLIRTILFLLPATLLGACTDNLTDNGEGTPLPEGKYPMEFTSQMYGLEVNTRSVTDNNTWTGSEEVAVKFGDIYNSKNYIASADGSLTCSASSVPFYWTKSDETVTITAWYQKGESFSSQPFIFYIESDQSTKDKYDCSDFIMACQKVAFADAEKKLIFKHLTAKVIVNLRGDGTTGDASTAQIRFINSYSLGVITAKPSADLSGISVQQTRLGAYSSNIKPYELTPANGFQKSVQVLLPPLYADGVSSFIRITYNGKDYYYTPSSADCDLQSGKQYTFNITVKDSGISAQLIDVHLSDSNGWSNGGSEDIDSTPTPAHNPQTRTMENGYKTVFELNDAIGLYSVDSRGTLVIRNACLRLKSIKGELKWANLTGEKLIHKGERYFVYYPYASTPRTVNVQATTAEEFFADNISTSSPSLYQYDKNSYTNNDLMVGSGLPGAPSENVYPLTITLDHQMGLAVISFPKGATNIAFDSYRPYLLDGAYRLIVKPDTPTKISGTFTGDSGETQKFSFSANIPKGSYKTYTVR